MFETWDVGVVLKVSKQWVVDGVSYEVQKLRHIKPVHRNTVMCKKKFGVLKLEDRIHHGGCGRSGRVGESIFVQPHLLAMF